MDINKTVMITGKLSTAMRTLLLSVFDAMAEMRLRHAENPRELSNSVNRNNPGSWSGLSMKMEKRK
jgi:hypothetical protein